MSPPSDKPFLPSLAAAGIAATLNFPLWRASAMAHSQYAPPALSANSMLLRIPSVTIRNNVSLYAHAMKGPYPGMGAVVGGMTWARCCIFYGSDVLKQVVINADIKNPIVTTILPSFTVATFVQVVNMPLIRATITQQDPTLKNAAGKTPSTIQALSHIYKTGGIDALWHGTSAGLLKTVPKYVVSIIVKDAIGNYQKAQNVQTFGHQDNVPGAEIARQSFLKSIFAGVSGAVLTNPADVIRNEMFKDNKSSLFGTLKNLTADGPNKVNLKWMWRGVDKNLLAVAAPISLTIFLTDLFEQSSMGSDIKRRVTKRD